MTRTSLRLVLTIALCVTAFAVTQAAAPLPPRVHIADSKHLSTPLPYPYDEAADANAAVDAAFARAKANGKRVLIDFGGNWCPDCRILAGVMELSEVKPFLDAHFEIVSVDVGRFNKNLQISARFHVAKLAGVPWLVIADSDGAVAVSSYEVTDEHHTTPQAMVDYLARWAK
jgi:thiol-disulfide isomerase/thioredoxin